MNRHAATLRAQCGETAKLEHRSWPPHSGVGARKAEQNDGGPFAEKYPRLLAELEECFGEGERLMGVVRERLRGANDAV